jgi:ferredoxin
MDSIEAMEGEGPSSGSLRKLGLIMASEDAVALDAVASGIIGLDPSDVPTTRLSDESGLGVGNLGRIEVVGEKIQNVMVSDFRQSAIAARDLSGTIPGFMIKFVWGQMSVKPRVIERNCTGCLKCEKTCPVGAITVSGEIAEINYDSCVKCMCCHEVCRFEAIVPRRSWLGEVTQRIAETFRWGAAVIAKGDEGFYLMGKIGRRSDFFKKRGDEESDHDEDDDYLH